MTPIGSCAAALALIATISAAPLAAQRAEATPPPAAVRWVVTTCADSAYATYRARVGADVCLPTSLPGVGAAPGVRGSRAVVCAGGGPGYSVVRDRVGLRDRCERREEPRDPPALTGPARTGS